MRRITGLAIALMMVATVAMAQKPTGYTLKKGDIFTMTTTAKQDIQQEIQGQSMTTDQTITNTDELEVIEVKGDVYLIKVTGKRRAVSLQSPMGATEMDSDKEGAENAVLAIMNGKSFVVEMNRLGKVSKITGVKEMRETMTKEFTEAGMAAALDQMLAGFTDEQLKSTLEGQMSIYGGGDAAEWTVTTNSVVNNIPVELVNTFKWDDDKTLLAEAKIDMSGTMEMMGTTVKSAMAGDQQTIIDLDSDTGMPSKIQSIQSVEGNLEAQGMTIPMTIVSETTTTIVKK